MLKNCMARIGCLTVILVIAAGGWLYRTEIRDWWNRLDRQTALSEPSQRLAEEAVGQLTALVDGPPPQTVRLAEPEVQSLLTYEVAPNLPAGVAAPDVEMRDSTIVLSAEIDLDALADESTAAALRSLLGDSTRVTVELEPDIIRPGVGQVRIHALQAGALPVPSLVVPMVLQQVEIPGADVSGTTILFALPQEMSRLVVADSVLELQTSETP